MEEDIITADIPVILHGGEEVTVTIPAKLLAERSDADVGTEANDPLTLAEMSFLRRQCKKPKFLQALEECYSKAEWAQNCIYARTETNISLAHSVAQKGNLSCLEVMSRLDKEVLTQSDYCGSSPLDYAMEENREKCIKFLHPYNVEKARGLLPDIKEPIKPGPLVSIFGRATKERDSLEMAQKYPKRYAGLQRALQVLNKRKAAAALAPEPTAAAPEPISANGNSKRKKRKRNRRRGQSAAAAAVLAPEPTAVAASAAAAPAPAAAAAATSASAAPAPGLTDTPLPPPAELAATAAVSPAELAATAAVSPPESAAAAASSEPDAAAAPAAPVTPTSEPDTAAAAAASATPKILGVSEGEWIHARLKRKRRQGKQEDPKLPHQVPTVKKPPAAAASSRTLREQPLSSAAAPDVGLPSEDRVLPLWMQKGGAPRRGGR